MEGFPPLPPCKELQALEGSPPLAPLQGVASIGGVLFMQCPPPTIRPQGDLNRVNLPFFPIFNQPNFQPIKPAEISKLTTHSSPSEHGNDTNNSN